MPLIKGIKNRMFYTANNLININNNYEYFNLIYIKFITFYF